MGDDDEVTGRKEKTKIPKYTNEVGVEILTLIKRIEFHSIKHWN